MKTYKQKTFEPVNRKQSERKKTIRRRQIDMTEDKTEKISEWIENGIYNIEVNRRALGDAAIEIGLNQIKNALKVIDGSMSDEEYKKIL